MKTLTIMAVLAAASFPVGGAFAQSSGTASASSGVSSTLNSTTDARSYTDARTLIDQRNSNTDSTLRTAPQVSAPGMSNGHPCAYSPASVGISIIGGGIGAGGQKIDDACMLAQMNERGAAISMIASRNPSACKSLRGQGRIPANQPCDDQERRQAKRASQEATTSSRSAPRTTVETIAYSKCEVSSRGIEVRVARGSTQAKAVAACKEHLGY